ncbi:MAG: hypothetical protein WCR78_11405 [Arcobacteraceae bacterium]
MSNHTGTLLRIIAIFIGLISFWFVISLFFTFLIISIIDIQFNITNILYIFGILLFIRVFYPRYIFNS